MPLTPTNESKNNLAVTNEDKGRDYTWDEATFTWDEAEGTWDTQLTSIIKETKNSLSVSNEAKN